MFIEVDVSFVIAVINNLLTYSFLFKNIPPKEKSINHRPSSLIINESSKVTIFPGKKNRFRIFGRIPATFEERAGHGHRSSTGALGLPPRHPTKPALWAAPGRAAADVWGVHDPKIEKKTMVSWGFRHVSSL